MAKNQRCWPEAAESGRIAATTTLKIFFKFKAVRR